MDIIGILGRHLVRSDGYSVLSTVLKREIRELGKRDCKLLKEVTGLTEPTEENIKSTLNMAAMVLGLKLDLIEEKKVAVVECPFFDTLKNNKNSFMCNACIEYSSGIIDELANGEFRLERTRWLFSGDGSCIFKPVKKA